MKKELRGRKTNDYCIGSIIDLEWAINLYNSNELSDESAQAFNKEFGCDISIVASSQDGVNIVREAILGMYNNDITASVLFMYGFMFWYRGISRKIKKEKNEKNARPLDFMLALSNCSSGELRTLLAKEYDKKNIQDYILHAQYRYISAIKAHIIAKDKAEYGNIIKHNIDTVIRNACFLRLIDENFDVDKSFWLQWEYYPVDKTFRDVVGSFNSEMSKKTYLELSGKEYLYFGLINNANVDFSSVKALNIFKDGKNRTVYLANKPIDQVTLIYLAKRLNNEFRIDYPNRDKIMDLSFNLIDSLPRLDNYTIYKFDFKDFFDSVEIKEVYEKYLSHSNLYSHEKELIEVLAKKYKYCVQGLPISNALIEIISCDFDERIQAEFSESGLIFYKRYVDDCILIFNHKMKKEVIDDTVEKCKNTVFGEKVELSPSKTSYQTKLDGDDSFDYLGYSFKRCFWKAPKKNNHYFYYEFGIASRKIEKYKKQLDTMFKAYELDNNDRLLLRRIQYYDSRVVYYNYAGSKYANKCTWDVRGIINSYRMLRRYVIYDNDNNVDIVAGKKPYRIQRETTNFLRFYVKEKRNSLSTVPEYLQGKGCNYHTLWNGFLKNNSIVFQPNIGWSNELLTKRLIEIGGTTLHKSYYEKTRDYYTILIKKL